MRTQVLGPVLALAGLLATTSALSAQAQRAASADPLGTSVLNTLEWRLIGPANMSGRVSDVEGIPGPSRTFFFCQYSSSFSITNRS